VLAGGFPISRRSWEYSCDRTSPRLVIYAPTSSVWGPSVCLSSFSSGVASVNSEFGQGRAPFWQAPAGLRRVGCVAPLLGRGLKTMARDRWICRGRIGLD
jgi:hypothetical protein